MADISNAARAAGNSSFWENFMSFMQSGNGKAMSTAMSGVGKRGIGSGYTGSRKIGERGGGNNIPLGAIMQAVSDSANMMQGMSDAFKSKKPPLARRIGLYGYGGRVNKFGLGTEDIMGMGTNLVNIAHTVADDMKIEGTSDIKQALEDAKVSAQPKHDSFDNIASDWANLKTYKHISPKMLRDKTEFDDYLSRQYASGQGAAAGSAAGPIGAIVGGVVGGLASFAGQMAGKHKARKEARKVNALIDETNKWNKDSLINRADNVKEEQYMNAMANYSAFGGPVGYGYYQPIGGALDYDIQNRKLDLKEMEIMGENNGNPFNIQYNSNFSNPFAFGGGLHSYGADWDNGVKVVRNGGTHEDNPYEGVQMGVDMQGIPNLVEQDEVIWNDYVFSDRILVPDDFKAAYKLGKKVETFADAALELQRESEEMPNDPIAKRGLDDALGKLGQLQEQVRQQMRQQQQMQQQMAAQYAPQEGMHDEGYVEGYGDYGGYEDLGMNPYAMPEQASPYEEHPNYADGYAYGGRMFDWSGDMSPSESMPKMPIERMPSVEEIREWNQWKAKQEKWDMENPDVAELRNWNTWKGIAYKKRKEPTLGDVMDMAGISASEREKAFKAAYDKAKKNNPTLAKELLENLPEIENEDFGSGKYADLGSGLPYIGRGGQEDTSGRGGGEGEVSLDEELRNLRKQHWDYTKRTNHELWERKQRGEDLLPDKDSNARYLGDYTGIYGDEDYDNEPIEELPPLDSIPNYEMEDEDRQEGQEEGKAASSSKSQFPIQYLPEESDTPISSYDMERGTIKLPETDNYEGGEMTGETVEGETHAIGTSENEEDYINEKDLGDVSDIEVTASDREEYPGMTDDEIRVAKAAGAYAEEQAAVKLMMDMAAAKEGESPEKGASGMTDAEVSRLAKEVIAGKYGYGAARKKKLGENYKRIQDRVNEMMGKKRAYGGNLFEGGGKSKNRQTLEREDALAQDWLENRLRKRGKILRRNMEDALGRKVTDAELAEEMQLQIDSMRGAKYNEKGNPPTWAWGMYYPTSHEVAYAENAGVATPLHERGHAQLYRRPMKKNIFSKLLSIFKISPQEQAIKKKLEEMRKAGTLYREGEPIPVSSRNPKYYENPQELYNRRNETLLEQERYLKREPAPYEKLWYDRKGRKTLKDNNLYQFSDDFLDFLYDEVADNGSPYTIPDTNYAAYGGKVGNMFYKGGVKPKNFRINRYKGAPIETFPYWDKNAINPHTGKRTGWYQQKYLDYIDTWNEDIVKKYYEDKENMARYNATNKEMPTVEEAKYLATDGKVYSDWHRYAEQQMAKDRTSNNAPWASVSIYKDPIAATSEEIEGTEPVFDSGERLVGFERPEGPYRDLGPTPEHSWLENLRYAPAIGSGLAVLRDMFTHPDYSNADAIANAGRGIRDIGFKPIGDYQRYNPLDREFYINQLNAQSGATRRNILNTSGGNNGAARAALLASDYNAQMGLGNLARQAEEYNRAQYERVKDFNRATNMFNSQGFLDADKASNAAAAERANFAYRAAALREDIKNRMGANKSANLSMFFNNLGNVGIDAYNRYERDWLRSRGIYGPTWSYNKGLGDYDWWKAADEIDSANIAGDRDYQKDMQRYNEYLAWAKANGYDVDANGRIAYKEGQAPIVLGADGKPAIKKCHGGKVRRRKSKYLTM